MKHGLILASLLMTGLFVKGQVTFQKIYQGSEAGYGTSIRQLSDTGYLIGGAVLIRTNAYGDTVLTKDLVGQFYDVMQTSDKGYMLASQPVKMDSLGNVEWAKALNWAQGPCEFRSVTKTFDGGYLFGGDCWDNANVLYYLSVVKLDSTGNLLWSKLYDFYQGSSGGYSIVSTPDNCFAVLTYAYSGYHMLMTKINSQGDIVWAKSYGGVQDNQGRCLILTQDGGFAIAGGSTSFSAGSNRDCYLVKTDSSGDLLWSRTYGGPNLDDGLSVKQTNDMGYILTGLTLSFGAGNYDVYLIKTDANGDTLWTRTYGGLDIDVGSAVDQTYDGGYIITGYTKSFSSGDYAVYLIKTDEDGNSGCNQNNTSTIVINPATQIAPLTYLTPSPPNVSSVTRNFNSISLVSNICSNAGLNELSYPTINIYPNPNYSTFTIEGQFQNAELKMLDITGREVFATTLTSKHQSLTTNLSSGVYFVKITDVADSPRRGKKVFTQKLVIQSR